MPGRLSIASLGVATCLTAVVTCSPTFPQEPQPAKKAATEKPAEIVGTWEAVDRHVAMGSLYQPVHGVRKRESLVTFYRDGDKLQGRAVHADHQAISFQERWKEGRTEFKTVTLEGDRLVLEFEIDEWRKEAGPLAVEAGRLENKGTIRVEAQLQADRLTGVWKMLLADGSEVFRGEWEARRAKETTKP